MDISNEYSMLTAPQVQYRIDNYGIFLRTGGFPGVDGVEWSEWEKLENSSNKVNVIDENVTDEQYPSAKAVWDALQNLGGSDVSDFIESDLVDYNDLDDLNHKNIDTNGKVYNKFYRGIDGRCIPFLLLVQISFEDSPWTYQTSIVCLLHLKFNIESTITVFS